MLFARKTQEDKFNRFLRQKIREAREQKGMTQEELASQIRKSRVFVSDIERGRTRITAVDLMGIAYNLEKPINYFFPVHVPTEGDLDNQEWELIHHFRRIGTNQAIRDLAINQVRQLADVATEADIKAHIREVDQEQLQNDRTYQASEPADPSK